MDDEVREKDNYRILGDLVVNFATRELQKIFFARYETLTKEKWGQRPSLGKHFFETRPANERRRTYTNATAEDRKKLEGDAANWDITMLDLVLSNIDFSAQNKTLKNLHDEENKHIKAIKNVRNKYSHPTQKQIPDVPFTFLWEKATAALVALGSSESEIDKIKASRHVTHFKLFDPPTKKFTGRKELLQKIHNQMLECSTKDNCLDRIVVLSGLGGIGKSELARMYAKTYIQDPVIQNVAWIDAQEEKGLTRSFASIANKFRIPTENKGLQEIVTNVYEHFSNHIQNGVFIFDNSKQMKGSPFGIFEYLPTQEALKRKPLILLTARDKKWNIPNQNNVIHIKELSRQESIQLLETKFSLAKEHTNYEEYKTLVVKLADALQGYPLALALATSNIKSNKNWIGLKHEIEAYLDSMREPGGVEWIELDQRRAATKYKHIMEDVWEVTLKKIRAVKGTGENAIKLLSLIAYFPPDQIEKEHIDRILKACYFTKLRSKLFQLLEKYSLIKVKVRKGYSKNTITTHFIRIHRLVQLTTRGKRDREKDFSYLLRICEYFSYYTGYTEAYLEKETITGLHEFLKERQWPGKSIQFSIVFDSRFCKWDDANAFNMSQDIVAFVKMNEIEKAKTVHGADVINLYCLCMFWINQYNYETNKEKRSPFLLKEEELESVFMDVVEPSTAFALTSTDDPKSLQEHSYPMCIGLLPNIIRLKKESSSQLLPRIISTLNATPCSSLKYISKLYKNMWKLLKRKVPESLTLLGPLFRKHFEIYYRLSSRDELRDYWGFWGDGPLDLRFVNDQLQDVKNRNEFLETFIRARGLGILCEHIVFLTQYKISLGESYAL